MTFPTWRDWLFSAKTYASAVMALAIALSFDLPRPYWAMTAVYVVANPIAGATLSKAFDRAFGTMLGSAGAILLVPLLVNAPILLTFAVALWAGTFLYIALLDRTPRNYLFMLAGYTLPLIALPNVTTPEAIFDVAVARSEEIILGIIIASVVNVVIFPTSIRGPLNGRITLWLKDAGQWASETLLAKGADHTTPIARQRFAADILPLNAIISQLSSDSQGKDIKRSALELRERLLLLLPLLSSITDRLHALNLERKALPDDLDNLTERIAAWITKSVEPGAQHQPENLREALSAIEVLESEHSWWEGLIRSSLISRLQELIALWQDCLTLQQQIRDGSVGGKRKPALQYRPALGRTQHYDFGLMAFAVCSVVLATFFAGMIWIGLGWTEGANFVAFVAIACCFFGGLDRPAPFMKLMLIWTCTAYALTGVYIFAILPYVSTFETLAIVLAPPFLLVGALIPRPQLSLITLLLAANVAGDLGIQGRFSSDFSSFANGGIAIAAGLIFSLVWTLITKPFGTEFVARRLVQAGWRDLAQLADGARRDNHQLLVSRSLDRLGQLMPRLASSPADRFGAIDGLAELRIAYNVVALQRDRAALPTGARVKIDEVLDGIASLFRLHVDLGRKEMASNELRHDIDEALTTLAGQGIDPPLRGAVDALVGLRRALFPDRPSSVANTPTALNKDLCLNLSAAE